MQVSETRASRQGTGCVHFAMNMLWGLNMGYLEYFLVASHAAAVMVEVVGEEK